MAVEYLKKENAAPPLNRKSFGGSHPQRSAAARWGNHKDLFTRGFLVVPHRFLHHYSLLDPPLTTGEALFVLHLMSFKWDRELPFPSYKLLAQRMGVTDKAVRRYAQALDRKGYLQRHYRKRAPNRFDLTGLFDALASLTIVE